MEKSKSAPQKNTTVPDWFKDATSEKKNQSALLP
jgi:hypothetical protein